ncbi:MAG: hypothetical protein D6732_01020 [Methanobacteriota archaeon]|nr:MAG: hypothetical protein D6732_01020 [Euryarchaeota archaeon]
MILLFINGFPMIDAENGSNSIILTKEDTTISIIQSEDVYSVDIQSSNGIIVSKSQMYQATFESFANKLIQSWPQSESNSGLYVNLTYGEIHLMGFLNPNESTHADAYDIASSIFEIYVGSMFEDARVWPVDLSLAVLESFPEQYQVSAIIQRAPDILAVVYEFNVYLFAWSLANVSGLIEQKSPLDLQNAIMEETVSGSINSGGGFLMVDFPIFSVGSEYRPQDLIFAVVVDMDGAMLVFAEEPYGTVLNFSSITLTYTYPAVTEAPLPMVGSILFVIVAVPVIKKKFKSVL